MRLLMVICAFMYMTSAFGSDLADMHKNPGAYHLQMLALIDAINTACSCTIDGVSIGNPNDKSTWRIDFNENITPSQIAAAKAALQAFKSQ